MLWQNGMYRQDQHARMSLSVTLFVWNFLRSFMRAWSISICHVSVHVLGTGLKRLLILGLRFDGLRIQPLTLPGGPHLWNLPLALLLVIPGAHFLVVVGEEGNIRNAYAGFSPDFRRWWPSRTIRLQGRPKFFEDIRLNYRLFESWTVKSKVPLPNTKVSNNISTCSKPCVLKGAETLDFLTSTCSATIHAIDPSTGAVLMDSTLDFDKGSCSSQGETNFLAALPGFGFA